MECYHQFIDRQKKTAIRQVNSQGPTIVLLHFDDQGDPYKDECGNTWTTVGNPSLTDSNAKFGKAIYFNNQSQLKTNIYLSGVDLTIDFWLTVHSYGTNTGCYSLKAKNKKCKSGYNVASCVFFYGGKVRCGFWNNVDTYYINGSAPLTLNVPAHYALSYVASTHTSYWFQNGKLYRAYSEDNTYCSSYGYPIVEPDEYELVLNSSIHTSGKSVITIDEFRIVEGVALWTEDFIPPTEPYKY